jgi:hypothetical protein
MKKMGVDMNFGRVVNIFIIIFLIANIVLYGAYEYISRKQYTISTEKEIQLNEILAKNNIYIYCLLPKYEPRKKMLVKHQELEKEKLAREFFEDSYTYKLQAYQEIFQKEDEQIIVFKGGKEGVISYTNNSSETELNYQSKAEVVKFGKQLMNKLTMKKGNMKLTSSQLDDNNNYYNLEYNDIMKKEIIFSNYVRIRINGNGVISADSYRYEPVKFLGEKKRIVSVDEVLYKFMYNMRQKDNNELIKIMGIDIGYHVEEYDMSDKDIIEAEPCYRISLGSGEVHYINAYNNKEVYYTNSFLDKF